MSGSAGDKQRRKTKFHIEAAKKNGVTRDERVGIITPPGFCVGWPKAWAAFNMAKEVYAEP